MRKNKNLLILLFLLVFAAGAFLFVSGTDAATGLQYTLLEKIPGTDNVGSDLPGYLKAIYKVALIIIVLSAVLMLSIGGFMYLTSAGNTSAMGTAKGVIFDSIIGLVIALTAYLLLYVINPDLVNVTINGLSPVSVPGAPPAAPPVPPAGQYSHAEAEKALKAAGIGVTSTGNCSDRNNPSCTSLEGIPKSTVDDLVKLKNQSGCNFNVTGGTETGHSAHGSGRSVVDVSESECLRAFLRNSKAQGTLTSASNVTQICATQANQDVAFQCSTIEAKPHFHLVFKT